jgi:hypothetical protein
MAAFGSTRVPKGMEKLLLINRDSEKASEIDTTQYSKTKEWMENFEQVKKSSSLQAHSGTHSFEMDSSILYSPLIEKMYKEITSHDHAKLKVSILVYCPNDVASVHGSLVSSFDHNGYTYGYKSLDIESANIEPNKWTEISLYYLTPVPRLKTDKLKVYFLQRGKVTLFVDDIKVEVWEKKD